jgi:hypothetical protein
LRELAIIELDGVQDRPLEILAAAEPAAVEGVLDPSIEPLHHAI